MHERGFTNSPAPRSTSRAAAPPPAQPLPPRARPLSGSAGRRRARGRQDGPHGAGASYRPCVSALFSHFKTHSGAFTFKYNVTPVPMVGMFEAAILAANASGDYDKARTCAVQKLEQVKSLPYEAVEEGLQGGVCAPSGFGYTIPRSP